MKIMPFLHDALQEEYQRLLSDISSYKKKIDGLPKGSIRSKEISGRIYYYLQYRNGNQIRSDYIKIDELENVQFQIGQRKRLVESLRGINQDIRLIEKVIKCPAKKSKNECLEKLSKS